MAYRACRAAQRRLNQPHTRPLAVQRVQKHLGAVAWRSTRSFVQPPPPPPASAAVDVVAMVVRVEQESVRSRVLRNGSRSRGGGYAHAAVLCAPAARRLHRSVSSLSADRGAIPTNPAFEVVCPTAPEGVAAMKATLAKNRVRDLLRALRRPPEKYHRNTRQALAVSPPSIYLSFSCTPFPPAELCSKVCHPWPLGQLNDHPPRSLSDLTLCSQPSHYNC
jgi:hypothetical protein